MKKSYYQLYTKLYDDYYLWVNFMNNSHLILNRELHDLYSKADDVENLKRQHTQLFDTLEKNGFIINDDFDELAYIEFEKKRTKDKCKQCKMYPSCLGPCTLHLMNGDETCFLESLNLSLSEYMMFLYKNEMIRKKVYEQ